MAVHAAAAPSDFEPAGDTWWNPGKRKALEEDRFGPEVPWSSAGRTLCQGWTLGGGHHRTGRIPSLRGWGLLVMTSQCKGKDEQWAKEAKGLPSCCQGLFSDLLVSSENLFDVLFFLVIHYRHCVHILNHFVTTDIHFFATKKGCIHKSSSVG